MKPIRVAYDRVRRCSEEIPDVFWSNGAKCGRNQRIYGQKSHSGLCDSTGISDSASSPDDVWFLPPERAQMEVTSCWKDHSRPRGNCTGGDT